VATHRSRALDRPRAGHTTGADVTINGIDSLMQTAREVIILTPTRREVAEGRFVLRVSHHPGRVVLPLTAGRIIEVALRKGRRPEARAPGS
jgi:hypothetical protein